MLRRRKRAIRRRKMKIKRVIRSKRRKRNWAMKRRGEGPPKLRGDPSSSGRRGVLLFQKGFCALCPVPSSLYCALLKSGCSLFTVLCAQQNLSVASCLLALHSHSLAWGPQPHHPRHHQSPLKKVKVKKVG